MRNALQALVVFVGGAAILFGLIQFASGSAVRHASMLTALSEGELRANGGPGSLEELMAMLEESLDAAHPLAGTPDAEIAGITIPEPLTGWEREIVVGVGEARVAMDAITARLSEKTGRRIRSASGHNDLVEDGWGEGEEALFNKQKDSQQEEAGLERAVAIYRKESTQLGIMINRATPQAPGAAKLIMPRDLDTRQKIVINGITYYDLMPNQFNGVALIAQVDARTFILVQGNVRQSFARQYLSALQIRK